MSLTDDYLRLHPWCQYTQAVGRYVDFGSHVHKDLCVDHIWNRKGNHEHWSNYATASPAAHEWKHRNSVVARIGIMWWKQLLTADDWRHFNLDALRSASGFWIPGWIENKLTTVELPSWSEKMGRDLLERIEGSRGDL